MPNLANGSLAATREEDLSYERKKQELISYYKRKILATEKENRQNIYRRSKCE